MVNIDELMLRREHFPVHTFPVDEEAEKHALGGIVIPPYHPSMITDGLPFDKTLGVIDMAIEDTRRDLREIKGIVPAAQYTLDSALDPKTEEIKQWSIVRESRKGIKFENVPFTGNRLGTLFVGRKTINPFSSEGDMGIYIDAELGDSHFSVPREVSYGLELMEEYEMEEEGPDILRKKRIKCPNIWWKHNLGHYDAIFYKNLVRVLDNTVVMEKYSE